jgi:hypothetical protein
VSDHDNDNGPGFDRKLDWITAGANRWLKKHLLTKISRENCKVIIDYILSMQAEYLARTIHEKSFLNSVLTVSIL